MSMDATARGMAARAQAQLGLTMRTTILDALFSYALAAWPIVTRRT